MADTQIVTRVMADPVRQFLPASYWNRARDWFAWPLDFNTLAAGANAQADTFQVQNDADFLVLRILAHATTTAAATTEQPEQNFLISVQDTGSGAQWFGSGGSVTPTNGFAHIMNVADAKQRSVAGDVAAPGMCHPRFVPAASAVTVSLTNLDAANARRVFLLFEGIKIYRSLRQGQ